LDLFRHVLHGFGADAAAAFAAERLAAELEQHAGIFWAFGGRHENRCGRNI